MNTFSFSNKVAIMKNGFFCLCACFFSVCVPIKHSIRIEKRTKPLEYHPRQFFSFYLQNLNIIHDTNNGLDILFPFPWFAYLERENDIRKKSRKGYISNSVTGIGKEKRLVHLAWLGVQ